jgi:beta-lactamase regulating signal transducer with metallopeptidase domain
MTLMLLATAWLLTYFVHSTILLSGAFGLAALRLVRSHAARDVMWKVALVGGLLTATTQLVLAVRPATGQVALSAVTETADVEASVVTREAASAAPAAVDPFVSAGEPWTLAAAPVPVPDVWPIGRFHAGWPGLVLNLWLLGALAFGAVLLLARRGLARRLATRREISAGPLAAMLDELRAATGVTQPVRLSVSDAIAGPISFGRGEICLPARVLSRLSREEQRAVLAHELGHIVRRDPLWCFGSAAICAVLFLQPLNRLARRRLLETAEYLCDDWAADRTGGGLVLARCLAEVATWMTPSAPELEVAPAMAARPSQLVARVQRLVDGGSRHTNRGAWRSRFAAGLLGVVSLGLVAWSAPGVAAGELVAAAGPGSVAGSEAGPASGRKAASAELANFAPDAGDGWLSIRDNGRQLVLGLRYSARLTGAGRLGFRHWGRVLSVSEGYFVTVNGARVADDLEVCTDQQVRIMAPDGRVAWVLEPLSLEGRESRLARAPRGQAWARDNEDAESKLDAAIDTLVRAWARDPAAVRLAAARLARSFERELAPQLESLGVALGRELEPDLARITSRIGRDLAPEFARLGTELGRSLASAIIETDGALPGQAAADVRGKLPKRGR